ncbi:MAG: selenium-dependent molybdenum cofactor biosynthesis protein YqeB [Clostridia bacterium]|nr:selenium-dependent molybdenum cofactor biosynthesis protein YqeB [Clostridia bacterium]MDH7573512.1 selenium-dependent molybdenum cofactor biosynthesis protein YqeB [Clostridia bacterium]
MRPETVVIRGAGELATGIAHRLRRSGFPVVMLELPQPTVERRTVALAEAVYEGEVTVEGVRGIRIEEPGAVQGAWARGAVPVLVDPEARCLGQLRPTVLVDAIMAKMNVGTRRDLAPVVIGVGPGFVAGLDADAVVETQCGHYLGRVIYRGAADPHTGVPGEILGYSEERVLRVPPEAAGRWEPNVEIGHKVSAEEVVAWVGNTPVRSRIAGVVRGLLRPGLEVRPGQKVGDVDPRGRAEYCFSISDRARAVAGGVLEAICHLLWVNPPRK